MFDIISFIPRAVVQGIPLLLGSTGETLTEKSGNLNLGIPGIMYVGAISGVIGSFFYEQASGSNFRALPGILIPILCCLLGSLLMGLLYCFLTVTLRANQNVTGLALTTFGVGFGNFFGGSLMKLSGSELPSIILTTTSNCFRRSLPFAGKLGCEECGTVYGSKVWHSTDRYRRVIWQCNSKYSGEHKCKTPHLTEQQIQDAFCRAIEPLLSDRARIIGDLEAVKEGLCDETDLIEKQEKLAAEMEVLEGLMHKAIMVNAETEQDQEEYNQRYDGYAVKHEKLKKQYGDAQSEREACQNKAQILDSMIEGLRSAAAVIPEFDGKLWNATVDHVTVSRDGILIFTMLDGREITVRS